MNGIYLEDMIKNTNIVEFSLAFISTKAKREI